MAQVEHEIVIRRPIEDVFGYLADMSHVPQWMSEDFTSVIPDTPDAPRQGTGYRYVAKGGATGSWEWSQFDNPSTLVWWGPPAKVGPGSVEGHGAYLLSPVDGGTRVIVRLEPGFGGLLKLLAPLSVGRIRRKLPAQLNRLKSILEGDRQA